MPSGFATALALAAGAVGGWGKGELENIKATRDEKLRKLELDRTERLQKLQIDAQHTEGEASRAVQREQIGATRDAAAATLALQGELGREGNRLEGARITSAETIAENQIEANRKLAENAEAHAERMGAVLSQFKTDPNDPNSPIIYRRTSPDGSKLYENPKDENGKELSIVPSADDTDDMKNVKGLMLLGGMSFKDAVATNFAAKGKETRQEATLKIFQDIENSASTMKNLNAADHQANWEQAEEMSGRLYPGEELESDGPPSSATEPAATTPEGPETAAESDEDLKFPAGTTEAEGIAWAKQQLAADMSRAAVAKVLKVNGIDPRKAGL